MQWYKKIGIGAGTFLCSLLPTAFIVQIRINESIQPYVENNLPEIIKKQEERLGIQHFGVPKIVYEQPPWVTHLTQAVAGSYDPENDLVYLPLGISITPEENITNRLATYISFGAISNIKETLDHELGHFYTDKLHESLGGGNLPQPSNLELPDRIRIMLILEGIAEYFEKTMNNGKDEFEDSDWPEKLEDFWSRDVIYEGGFHLVKTIIDRHGKKGIEYLVQNPPSVEDLDDLPAYQNKVLHLLSEKVQPH